MERKPHTPTPTGAGKGSARRDDFSKFNNGAYWQAQERRKEDADETEEAEHKDGESRIPLRQVRREDGRGQNVRGGERNTENTQVREV